jgi:hypothetical protein
MTEYPDSQTARHDIASYLSYYVTVAKSASLSMVVA